MDADTWDYFCRHVKTLEERALAGDEDATRSLCCMVLVRQLGTPPDDGGGVDITTFDGNIVTMAEWVKRRAA